MANLQQVLEFKGIEIRMAMLEDGPHWVARDVCDALELSDPSRALGRLDDDEKGTTSIRTLGGDQVMATVNEPGLYSLILGSRKKSAREFKRWVTHEVLPAIRQTGSYSAAPSEVDKLAMELRQAFPLIGQQIDVARTRADEALTRVTAVEEQVKQTDPREIEERMFTLHAIKRALIDGTKSNPKPVTFQDFWGGCGKHIKVASFKNRAALTLEKMDAAIAYAQNWAFTAGVQPPTLFDQDGNGQEASA